MKKLFKLMRIVGWVATMFAGGVAAWGLGDFLPAAKFIVWPLGALLEVMNIITVEWLAHRHTGAPRSLRVFMLCLCVTTFGFDIVGVTGRMSTGFQGDVNAHEAQADEIAATFTAKIEAAKQAVALIDDQIKANAASIAEAGKAKVTANKARGEAAARSLATLEGKRPALIADRNKAAAAVTALQIEAGKARGEHKVAGGEFAALQFASALSHGWLSVDDAAHVFIVVLSSLCTLFALGFMIAGSVGLQYVAANEAKAAPVVVEVIDVPAPVVKVRKPNAKRSASAKQGWLTRRSNAAKPKANVVPIASRRRP